MRGQPAIIAIITLFAVASLASGASLAKKSRDCADCSPKSQTANAPTADLPALSKTCAPDDELYSTQANQEYDRWFGDAAPIATRNIAGLSVLDTPEKLSLAAEILGKRPPAGWSAAAQSCKDVLCVLRAGFGSEEAAKRALVIAKRNGYVVSLDQSKNFTADQRLLERVWTLPEVRMVDATLAELPGVLNRIPWMKQLYRVNETVKLDQIKNQNTQADALTAAMAYSAQVLRGGDDGEAEIYAEGNVVVYDRTFRKIEDPATAVTFRNVLIHELCHHVDYQGLYSRSERVLSEQVGYGFRDLSWSRAEEGAWEHGGEGQPFFEEYGGTTPKEDFATSCAAYYLDGATLWSRAPAKYAFMRENVFGGKEYVAEPPYSFPNIARLLDYGKGCIDLFQECVERVETLAGNGLRSVDRPKNSDGTRPDKSSLYRFEGTHSYWALSECVETARARGIQELWAQVLELPRPCFPGIADRIRLNFEKLCEPVFADMVAAKRAGQSTIKLERPVTRPSSSPVPPTPVPTPALTPVTIGPQSLEQVSVQLKKQIAEMEAQGKETRVQRLWLQKIEKLQNKTKR